MSKEQAEGGTNNSYRGCSYRAVATGLVLAVFMGVAIPYGDTVIKGSQMGVWNTNPGAIFLFFSLSGPNQYAFGRPRQEVGPRSQ